MKLSSKSLDTEAKGFDTPTLYPEAVLYQQHPCLSQHHKIYYSLLMLSQPRRPVTSSSSEPCISSTGSGRNSTGPDTAPKIYSGVPCTGSTSLRYCPSERALSTCSVCPGFPTPASGLPSWRVATRSYWTDVVVSIPLGCTWYGLRSTHCSGVTCLSLAGTTSRVGGCSIMESRFRILWSIVSVDTVSGTIHFTD